MDRVRGLSPRSWSDLKPDVIVCETTPTLKAVADQTSAIPIVFVSVADPVSNGFVADLARPGGNITGFTNFEATMGGKWIELLKKIAPALEAGRCHLQSGHRARRRRVLPASPWLRRRRRCR